MSEIQALKLFSTLLVAALVWGLASIGNLIDFEPKRPATRDRNR